MMVDAWRCRTFGQLAAGLVVLLAWSAAGAPLWADEPTAAAAVDSQDVVSGAAVVESKPCATWPRPQDQLWAVSSRGLGCDVTAGIQRLRYWRYDREQCWVKSNLDELLAGEDADAVTTVFIHGNRVDHCEAFSKGWSAYRRLVACADERPVRFVIWSWPSDPIRGPVQDARIKAGRTNPAGYYVAWFVNRLQPGTSVSLWAHSYGARIATGALHLLGGGSVAGYRLKDRDSQGRRPVQAVLLASAVDDHWLLPGHAHGQAMSQLDGLLLVNNGCDNLLKRYQLLYPGRGCEQALGYVGLATSRLHADDAAKVRQLDAANVVGREHLFANYLCSPGLVAQMRTYLLFEGQSPPAPLASAVNEDLPEGDAAEAVDKDLSDRLTGES